MTTPLYCTCWNSSQSLIIRGQIRSQDLTLFSTSFHWFIAVKNASTEVSGGLQSGDLWHTDSRDRTRSLIIPRRYNLDSYFFACVQTLRDPLLLYSSADDFIFFSPRHTYTPTVVLRIPASKQPRTLSRTETQWPLGGFYHLSDYLGNKSTWNILIELQLLREIVGLWDEPFLSFPLKTWKVNDRTDDTPPWFNSEVPRAAQTTWQHSNRVTTRRSATQTDWFITHTHTKTHPHTHPGLILVV